MDRDASGCLMCHLTGLYGLQREKTYDAWLLKIIEEQSGRSNRVAHFSQFYTFLSFGNLLQSLNTDELKACWQVVSTSAQGLFTGLQFEGKHDSVDWLEWNQQLDKPFHILMDAVVLQVQNPSITSQMESFEKLKELMVQVFDLAALPVDGIRFINGDFLWEDKDSPAQIVPQNHYVHRHVRSTLDRIQAPLALVMQSQGSLADVKDYWSDGQNEVQLAGSAQFAEAILNAVQNGDVSELTAMTDQFRSLSMETAYFHSLFFADKLNYQFSTAQALAAWFILLSCTGVCVVDVPSLMRTFLTAEDQSTESPLAGKLQRVFSNPAFQPLAKLLTFRQQNTAFLPLGAQISMQSTPSIWAVQRFSPDMVESVLCLANSGSETQEITLGEENLKPGSHWQEFRGGKSLIAGEPWLLQPYEGLWLREG
jgi:hypothetical protein